MIEHLGDCFAQWPCIAITGGPGTGKTTVAREAAERYGRPVRHTDDLIVDFDWSQASDHASRWFDEPGPWIIEGVAVPRALRKWLAAHPGKPLNIMVIYLQQVLQPQTITKGREIMARGVATVWQEILPELQRRGARVWREP